MTAAKNRTPTHRLAGRYLAMSPKQIAKRMQERPGQFAKDVLSMAGYIVNDAPDKPRD